MFDEVNVKFLQTDETCRWLRERGVEPSAAGGRMDGLPDALSIVVMGTPTEYDRSRALLRAAFTRWTPPAWDPAWDGIRSSNGFSGALVRVADTVASLYMEQTLWRRMRQSATMKMLGDAPPLDAAVTEFNPIFGRSEIQLAFAFFLVAVVSGWIADMVATDGSYMLQMDEDYFYIWSRDAREAGAIARLCRAQGFRVDGP